MRFHPLRPSLCDPCRVLQPMAYLKTDEPADRLKTLGLGMPGGRLIDWNVHLSEAAGYRGVHRGDDERDVRLKGQAIAEPQ